MYSWSVLALAPGKHQYTPDGRHIAWKQHCLIRFETLSFGVVAGASFSGLLPLLSRFTMDVARFVVCSVEWSDLVGGPRGVEHP